MTWTTHDSEKKLIAGNWKMNGSLQRTTRPAAGARRQARRTRLRRSRGRPAPCWSAGAEVAGSAIACQDVAAGRSAFTGSLRGHAARDFGARYVLVGHSERRQYHGPRQMMPWWRGQHALAASRTPIVCVGETLAGAGKVERRPWSSVSWRRVVQSCISEISWSPTSPSVRPVKARTLLATPSEPAGAPCCARQLAAATSADRVCRHQWASVHELVKKRQMQS